MACSPFSTIGEQAPFERLKSIAIRDGMGVEGLSLR